MTPHIDDAYVVVTLFTGIFTILLPFVAAAMAHRRLGTSWRYFGIGILIFFIFQVVTRIPAVQVISAAIQPRLQASPPLQWLWILCLALSAALFEETGRYVAFRWLLRHEEKTWNKAVMYGLGHGAIESSVLTGVVVLVSLVTLLNLVHGGLAAVPPSQRAAAAQQIAAALARPAWAPLAGAWERVWSLVIQVALSVIVLQILRRGQMRWYGLAIFAYTVVDGVSAGVPQALGRGTTSTLVITEAIIALCGIVSIRVIWTLRDQPARRIDTAGGAP